MYTIDHFASDVLKKPLYPYQLDIAQVILNSIAQGEGKIFTVMMSRQAGKNQLSAVLEAYLLYTRPRGTIIKAAPTFSPQIINSRARLLSMLSAKDLRQRVWTSFGEIGLAPHESRIAQKLHQGPSVKFFSANPESNVVGATADILLEIDEAQDITPEKLDRDFRPMASTTNATTVLYGTAWSDETPLAMQRAINLEIEERTGDRRHFAVDWRTVAEVNPKYKAFVEGEIERLGEDHISIQTQYLLHATSSAGYFLTEMHRLLLQGTHDYEGFPDEGIYIASMDVGGEERVDPKDPTRPLGKRDSTVFTIGKAKYTERNLPMVEVVHHEWWEGMHYQDQFAYVSELMDLWNIRKLVVDKTGVGEGLASLLVDKWGDERVQTFQFTRPSKSRIGYALIELINSGRIKLYAKGGETPREKYEELWKQLKRARYRLPAAETIDFYVEPGEGHDDFLISLALLSEALTDLTAPAASDVIRPKRLYEGEGRF